MEDLIDLERYPLHRLDSDAGEALVARCIAALGQNGMFTLPGLMRRAEFEPALGKDGQPIASYWHSTVRFQM